MYDDAHTKELNIASGIVLFLILAFVAFVAVTTLVPRMFPERGSHTTLRINNLPISVKIARTEEQKTEGMTGKKNIPWNSGILFVFDTKEAWRVSMTGMHFALDIFWVDENGKIVYIEHNAQPYDGSVINPGVEAVYILEMRGDFADVHNIEVGNIIEF